VLGGDHDALQKLLRQVAKVSVPVDSHHPRQLANWLPLPYSPSTAPHGTIASPCYYPQSGGEGSAGPAGAAHGGA
jgi:hypothetical protein